MAGPAFDLNKLKNIKLTKEQQQAIALSVMLLGGGIYGYWNFVLVPYRTSITSLEKILKEKQDNIEKARKLKGQWEEYNQRLARVQTGLAFVARRLPPAVGLDLGIARLIRLATEGGMDLTQAAGETDSVRGKSEFEGFRKSTMNVTFTGEFHRLGDFIARLSGEDLVYVVDELNMRGTSRADQDTKHISTTTQFKLITYFEIVPEGK